MSSTKRATRRWSVRRILFYASERAGWITGTTMPIDGGVLAGRNAPPAPVAEPAAA